MKAFAWQGDLSFGPRETDARPFSASIDNPRWAGVPDLDEAGMRAVEAYFRAYGPATPDHVQYWLGEGLGAGRKRIQAWIAGFGDRLAALDIDGEPAYVLREDLEELAGTRRPRRSDSCRDTTSGCSVRAPPTPISCHRQGVRWSAVRPIS